MSMSSHQTQSNYSRSSHSSKSTLRCLQINLRHSKLASASLAQVAIDLAIDVVLVQEPCALSASRPLVSDIPPGFAAYHSLSSDHAYGSVILIRSSILNDIPVTENHLSNHAACVDIKLRDGSLRLISLYLRPSIQNFAETTSEILDFLSSSSAVFGIDSNAKNSLWNCATTDQKGSDLETLILRNKLNVVNVSKESLDFVPAGTGFIDLTLAGDQVVIPRWLFLPLPSLSDHPFLFFEIKLNSPIPTKLHPASSRSGLNAIPHVSKINKQVYLDLLRNELSSMPSDGTLAVSKSDVPHMIDSLTECIVKSARAESSGTQSLCLS